MRKSKPVVAAAPVAPVVSVVIVQRENGPERLACEAELHFADGPLQGLKLVGFSIWRTADGELYVTFPSRAFGVGTERRYFDYLRPASVDGTVGTLGDAKRVKEWILDAYRAHLAAAA